MSSSFLVLIVILSFISFSHSAENTTKLCTSQQTTMAMAKIMSSPCNVTRSFVTNKGELTLKDLTEMNLCTSESCLSLLKSLKDMNLDCGYPLTSKKLQEQALDDNMEDDGEKGGQAAQHETNVNLNEVFSQLYNNCLKGDNGTTTVGDDTAKNASSHTSNKTADKPAESSDAMTIWALPLSTGIYAILMAAMVLIL